MRTRQQGAGLLIPVLLVITVAAFAVVVAASQSAGDIHGSDANADAQQALFVAETGLERALKRFATGTACGGALAETITDLSTIGLGTTAYSITIGSGLTTDLAGAALPATQCRVPVTGTVIASNVTRTIHAIVDRNLLEGADNPTFNNPTTAGLPSGWTLDPPTSFANNGGPDGAAPACSRSGWLVKTTPGAGTVTGSGQANVSFTVTGGSTTTITFHWRIVDRGAGCTALAAGPAVPCGGAGGNKGSVCFQTTDSGGTNSTSATYNDDQTVTVGAVACPSTYSPCEAGYQPGYPTKTPLTMTMGGAGTRTIATFRYYLRLQQAGRREIFLDHIEAVNNTAVGAAYVKVWRDCSTAPCP